MTCQGIKQKVIYHIHQFEADMSM